MTPKKSKRKESQAKRMRIRKRLYALSAGLILGPNDSENISSLKKQHELAMNKQRGDPIYTQETLKMLLSKKEKSTWDKIKEILEHKDLGELRIEYNDLLDKRHVPKSWRSLDKDKLELVEAIADLYLFEMKRSEFDVRSYYKNLFRGRQKGRAYKSFYRH